MRPACTAMRSACERSPCWPQPQKTHAKQGRRSSAGNNKRIIKVFFKRRNCVTYSSAINSLSPLPTPGNHQSTFLSLWSAWSGRFLKTQSTMCGLWWLASLTYHNVFQAHPCCRTLTVSHCVDIRHSIFLLLKWWTCELFALSYCS